MGFSKILQYFVRVISFLKHSFSQACRPLMQMVNLDSAVFPHVIGGLWHQVLIGRNLDLARAFVLNRNHISAKKVKQIWINMIHQYSPVTSNILNLFVSLESILKVVIFSNARAHRFENCAHILVCNGYLLFKTGRNLVENINAEILIVTFY